jgi:hypothetical protein
MNQEWVHTLDESSPRHSASWAGLASLIQAHRRETTDESAKKDLELLIQYVPMLHKRTIGFYMYRRTFCDK